MQSNQEFTSPKRHVFDPVLVPKIDHMKRRRWPNHYMLILIASPSHEHRDVGGPSGKVSKAIADENDTIISQDVAHNFMPLFIMYIIFNIVVGRGHHPRLDFKCTVQST